MAGDVGLLAAAFKSVFDFAVTPEGYERMSREQKLKVVHYGIVDAINRGDGHTIDAFFAELRDLRAQTGP